MKTKLRFHYLLYLFLLVCTSKKAFSQCFQIESILVAACVPAGGFEGYNEMVRFKVGAAPLNTATLNVNWPSNPWQGLVQNAATAANVVTMNAQVVAAGGCAQVLEPTGGVLPANAEVLLVSSHLSTSTANVFGAITQDVYVIFQNNTTQQGGHFGNYSATPGMRTLSMSFGACNDSVTYDRTQLSNGPGATVNFTAGGAATYTNPGCVAPVEPFTVDAGTTPVNACPGATISLSGTAVGYTTLAWSAPSGTFSAPAALSTNYTLSAAATGSVVLTLSATNACGTTITDTVTVNVTASNTPTFNAVAPICSGATLSPLPTTSTNGITGSWSPALDNTATTTYTFTPTAGQCASSATLTINVNPLTTPTFNAVGPYCSGTVVPALPTTSTNGINGSWSPAINNTATTIYTFTPTAGQCAATTTLTITINSANTVPTFAAVAPICTGTTLSPLPTTSTNAIVGSWSPALDNTTTTIYTFTPNAGQCAVTTTLTITVNPNVTPTFTAVAPICSGTALAALPTTSTNGITGVWTPALNNTATTIYTFTPNAGQCASTTTMTITVNPANTVPTFAAVAPICSGAALSALPITSTNGITGSWTPALNNMATTIYTFTPNAGQCAVTTTLTITVNPSTTPTFNAVAPICSGATLSALPTTSTNGITGSWSPALNNSATTIYTFTPTAGQCASIVTLTITVNPNVTPTFTQVAPICSGAALSALPTTSTNGINGSWSPAINNTATTTYTFTPNAGQCATAATMTITVNPIVTPTFTAVAPVCSGSTIAALPTTATNGITGSWTPALNNTTTTIYTFTPTAGQCAVTTTLTITVLPTKIPVFNAVAPICSGTTLTALPTTSTNGVTGSWSPALNNTATTTYTFTPTAGQCATIVTLTISVSSKVLPTFNAVAPICAGTTLAPLPTTSTNSITGSWSPALNNTATTTYTFTPSAGECATTTTLTVTVLPVVTPTFNAVGPICSGATLSALPTTSTNGITGSWSPALSNTTTRTYTFTPTAGQCATTTTLTITVNPVITPAFTPVAAICQGDILSALPTTSTNGVTGTWSPALNNMASTTYTFTPTAGQCAVTKTLTIIVNNPVVPTFNAVNPICSGAALAPLPTTSINGIIGTWLPALNNTATTTYTFVPDAGQCATSITMPIVVSDNVVKNETYYLCINGAGTIVAPVTINTGLAQSQYNFVWTFNGDPLANTANSYEADTAGNYTVVATNLITGCTTTIIADVIQSPDAAVSATVNNDFAELQQIVVTVVGGLGDYSYQLDNGPFQTSNVFEIFYGGDYTIRVKDNLGCNNFELTVTALDYPKFFTPNNDGYNDYWNIEGLTPDNEAKIYIFDRYGKLIRFVSPYGIGWDGTYNGKELPSTDYWFKLFYLDKNGVSKEFKSHFSLKR